MKIKLEFDVSDKFVQTLIANNHQLFIDHVADNIKSDVFDNTAHIAGFIGRYFSNEIAFKINDTVSILCVIDDFLVHLNYQSRKESSE